MNKALTPEEAERLAAEILMDSAQTNHEDELTKLFEELASCGIKVSDGDQFLAEELPPPIWIVPDLIAKHYQCALFGKSKTKKTFFALDFARHIATGRKFLNFPQPDKPHKVAYINIELMPYFMQERMRKQSGGVSRTLYGGNLIIFNCRGAGPKLREKVETIKRLCLLKGVEIIIIDPRYKLMQGEEDENSAAGLRALLEFRTSLAEAAAVALVGHDPKGDVSSKADVDRGSGSYTAIADDDCTILLTPNTNGDTGKDALTVEVIHRNRAPIEPFVAVFDAETLSFSVDDTILADTSNGKSESKLSLGERAKRNQERLELFAQAAVEVANEAGEKLIDCDTFKTRLLGKPNGNLFGAVSGGKFKTAWKTITVGENRPLKKCAVFGSKSRREFVSTPERIDKYLASQQQEC